MIVAMKIDIGDLWDGKAIMMMTMMMLVMPMKIDIDDLQIGRNDDRWLLENPQSPEIPQSTARFRGEPSLRQKVGGAGKSQKCC